MRKKYVERLGKQKSHLHFNLQHEWDRRVTAGKHPRSSEGPAAHKTHKKAFETNFEIPGREIDHIGYITNDYGQGDTSHFYVDKRKRRRK